MYLYTCLFVYKHVWITRFGIWTLILHDECYRLHSFLHDSATSFGGYDTVSVTMLMAPCAISNSLWVSNIIRPSQFVMEILTVVTVDFAVILYSLDKWLVEK